MDNQAKSGTPEEARWSRLEPRRSWEPQLIQHMLSRAIPGCRIVSIAGLSGGYRNANFKVHLESPALVIVLRIYEHDPALCLKEADLMRLVARTVPVAEPIYAETPETSEIPPFAVLKFVEGITLRELKRGADQQAIAQAASSSGKVLAALGKFTFPRAGWLSAGLKVTAPLLEGEDPLPRSVDLSLGSPHVQRRLTSDVCAQVHDLVWSWVDQLRELETWRSLVHCDFGMRNLLVRQEQGTWRVAALLDWEFAVSGSPLVDVAHFLRYELKARPLLEPHFSQAFVRAGGALPQDWRRLARIVDLAALVDTLVRKELPRDVEREISELIHATVENRDPQF